jgi:hypothetical protein
VNGGACDPQLLQDWVVVKFFEFFLAVAIAAGISMATFAHADRHGSTHATAWGIGAFLAAGVVVPVYIVRVWLGKRRPKT